MASLSVAICRFPSLYRILLFVPTVFRILNEGFDITIHAQPGVTANRATAGWAAPLHLLGFQEISHPLIPNGVQIFDHAHMIFCSIALIQSFQSFTRVRLTFKTKPDQTLSEQIASISHVGAVLTPGDAARAVLAVKTCLFKSFCLN
jgi:hypothetical protein